jgi:7-carboxy-7-deazaguanine synthase
MIKINEIFYSIQGESTYAGYPTVFVRTSGCPLRCTYCDTTYAYYEGTQMEVDSIIDEVEKHKTRFVCVTGGEPLIHKDIHILLNKLVEKGYQVSLETSGAIDCTPVNPLVKKVIDVKTPDSGAANSFLLENLKFNDVNTEFKFVLNSEKDFDWAEEFSQKNGLNKRSTVLYSPAFGKIDEKWLAKKMLSSNSYARLQLQLHKYIWSPQSRGV